MTRHTIGRLLLMFGLSIVLFTGSPAGRGVAPRAELRTQAGPATSALPTLQGHAAVTELEKRGCMARCNRRWRRRIPRVPGAAARRRLVR